MDIKRPKSLIPPKKPNILMRLRKFFGYSLYFPGIGGREWNVDPLVVYPTVEFGHPPENVSPDDSWKALAAYLFSFGELLSDHLSNH
jgi:hypothetical protein